MSELIMVGDRILISPDEGERQTEAGLLLPASVAEREKVRSGRVVSVGPGFMSDSGSSHEDTPYWRSDIA